jgi:hypothetical protein
MEEIKFRLWNPERGVITAGVDLLTLLLTTDDNFVKEFIAKKMIFEQFTGKRDSKGTNIYDGDIVEFDRREWGGSDNIHVVSWDDVNAEWCWGGGTTSDMEWRTVIGNIHQNPELISKRK